MEQILTRLIDLPVTVRGLTCKDDSDDYNIYINAKLNSDQQLEAYNHELGHIKLGHFFTHGPVAEKEAENG